MKANLNELTASLPDFNDFMQLAEQIEAVSLEREKLDIEIKRKEAEIIRVITTSPQYFQNGKIPSMTYIASTYQYCGLDNEMIPLREKHAELTVRLSGMKSQMETYKTMLDIWRTLSANARRADL